MITMPSVIQDYKDGNSLGLSLETFTKTNPDHQLANTMKLIYQVLINPVLFEENIVKIFVLKLVPRFSFANFSNF